jgi:hypothetical protein
MIPKEILPPFRKSEPRARRRARVPHHLALLLVVAGFFQVCVALAESQWATALKEQTDPAKLATLGKRGANPRVNRIVFYLHEAQASGTAPAVALDLAFRENGTTGLVAVISKQTQLLNFKHAQDWGLLTKANLEKLKRGDAPTITKGRSKGQETDVDHIVPVSLAPEAGNSLANLELLPASVNRSKGAGIGWREARFAGRLNEAGLLNTGTLWGVRWAFIWGWRVPAALLLAALVLLWHCKRPR